MAKREKVEIPITVRFTKAQLAAVEAAAEALGIERAQFIRMGALRECGWKPAATLQVLPNVEKKSTRDHRS